MHNRKIVTFDGDYYYHYRLFPETKTRTVDTLSANEVDIKAAATIYELKQNVIPQTTVTPRVMFTKYI